jgi:hypothetical protein
MKSKKLETAATAIEQYAKEKIPERNNAFGQFMYHAELLRRGHVFIHKQDLKDMPLKYQEVIKQIVNKH